MGETEATQHLDPVSTVYAAAWTLPPVFPFSHFSSGALLPLPAVPLPRTHQRFHTPDWRCRTAEARTFLSPRCHCFLQRCKVFTFLHNSSHKAARPPLSILSPDLSYLSTTPLTLSFFFFDKKTFNVKKKLSLLSCPWFLPPLHLLPFPIFITPLKPFLLPLFHLSTLHASFCLLIPPPVLYMFFFIFSSSQFFIFWLKLKFVPSFCNFPHNFIPS